MAQTPEADEPHAASKPTESTELSESVDTAGKVGDYGDYARQWVAHYTETVETMDAALREFEELFAKHVLPAEAGDCVQIDPLDGLVCSLKETSEKAKLFSTLSAMHAAAWERMQDAGGEDNPEALADFLATMEFHRALALDKRTSVDDPDSTSDHGLDE